MTVTSNINRTQWFDISSCRLFPIHQTLHLSVLQTVYFHSYSGIIRALAPTFRKCNIYRNKALMCQKTRENVIRGLAPTFQLYWQCNTSVKYSKTRGNVIMGLATTFQLYWQCNIYLDKAWTCPKTRENVICRQMYQYNWNDRTPDRIPVITISEHELTMLQH